MYTCNITEVLKYCTSYLYADDTQLLYSFLPTELEQAQAKINADLNSLEKISARHNLLINPQKSRVLVFGKRRKQVEQNIHIRMDCQSLSSTNVARNLGLLLDTNLRFSEHVIKCLKTAYANLKMLYPHRHVLSRSLKAKLTDILVLSHFNYADVVYGPCLTSLDANRIQRVQKSCLRYIYGIRKYEPVSFLLKDVQWLNMQQRRKLHSACLFHGILRFKSPPYLYNKIRFRSDVHTLNLRYRGLLSPPPHHTAAFLRSFSFNIYSLYNGVPASLKTLNSSNFKIFYKHELLTLL